MPHNQATVRYHPTETILALVGWLAFLVAGVTLFVSCISWLRTATWPEWTLLANGYTPPRTSYKGMNLILQWIYDLHFSWLAISIGAISWILALFVDTSSAK